MIKRNHALSLAADVAGLINRRRHVSMIEIVKLAGDEGKGDITIALKDNMVLWEGLSQALVDVLDELKQKKLYHPHPTISLAYLMDGDILTLPIVKRPPKNGYKKPHWLPVVLEPGQRCVNDPECPWYKEIG